MKNFSVIFLGEALSIPEFLLFMVGFVIVMAVVFTLVSVGADKSKEVAKNLKDKFEQKKQENLLNENIKMSMREYQESKNSFQYFSDNKLLNIYEEFQNSTKHSNMEQLALEEELVKRKLIDFSPMHEKLYAINKEFFK
jgi:predicted PurR-regulated permease PerM